jgi:ATP-binding cassette subfamily F protein uup
MEKREFEDLPQKIDALEKEQEDLYATVSDPLFYKKEKEETTRIRVRLDGVAEEIEKAYLRFEELDTKDS